MRLKDLLLDGSSLALFLVEASSLTKFAIEVCDIKGDQKDPGALQLAAALKRHAKVSQLELNRLGDIILLPILRNIGKSA